MSRPKISHADLMAMCPDIPTEDAQRIWDEVTGPNGWLEPNGVNAKGEVTYGFRAGIDIEALGRYLEKEVECAERLAP